MTDSSHEELSERGQKKIANDALDRDVYARIPSPSNGIGIVFGALVDALGQPTYPKERDIDRSLQRLRKGGAIRFIAGRWMRLPPKAV